MILDSSAIVALLLRQEPTDRLLDVVEEADICRVGAPTLLETAMVLTGRAGDHGRALLLAFMQETNMDVLSFTEAHWRVAQGAFVRFGKGRHPAALNLGDCLTYATVYVAGEPLLCVGDDFCRTDLELVEY
jgi:ribonuclease VapC